MAERTEDVILTWSFTNWFTVVIMVAVGFGVLKLGASLIGRANSGA